jgi:hypothetical protein
VTQFTAWNICESLGFFCFVRLNRRAHHRSTEYVTHVVALAIETCRMAKTYCLGHSETAEKTTLCRVDA